MIADEGDEELESQISPDKVAEFGTLLKDALQNVWEDDVWTARENRANRSRLTAMGIETRVLMLHQQPHHQGKDVILPCACASHHQTRMARQSRLLPT